jgi:hypothetical protein
MGFIASVGLLLAPILIVLWLRAGPAVEAHPTRAVVIGIGWLAFLGWVFLGRDNRDA